MGGRDYSIPLTISRGMSGPTVKKKIADRYWRSKKKNLILLVVADLDPAGDAIAQDIRDAFERDFGIHAADRGLQGRPQHRAGARDGPRAVNGGEGLIADLRRVRRRYGITERYELEALEPADLQQILEDAIEEVMDMDAY